MFNNIIPSYVVDSFIENDSKRPKQLHLDESVFYPCFYIKDEAFSSCNEAFTYILPNGYGPNGTIGHSVDHPAFNSLRNHLSNFGYVKIPDYPCVNGDIVIKPFYLNDVFFDINERFLSASAMSYRIKRGNQK